jgi:hypothetical protein
MLDIQELRARLPQVGQRLSMVPSYMKNQDRQKPQPQKCQVIAVNRRRLWYLVRYESGVLECFHVMD